jgi:hypothetical protein
MLYYIIKLVAAQRIPQEAIISFHLLAASLEIFSAEALYKTATYRRIRYLPFSFVRAAISDLNLISVSVKPQITQA